MTSTQIIESRLLSHRVRGFEGPEGSISSLKQAIDRGVQLIEIDTRHTSDNEIVVYHSPELSTLTTQKGLICQLPWQEVRNARFKNKNDEKVCHLVDLLGIVGDNPNIEVWIDIKDYGLEQDYVRYIREFRLERRVRVISWIPECLFQIHKCDPKVSLGFSYACTAFYPKLHQILRAIAIITKRQSRPLYLRGRRGKWADICAIVPNFHPIKMSHGTTCRLSYDTGYNHFHLIPGLPQGELLNLLCENSGAIGMFPYQATPAVVSKAHDIGLSVYVYCIDEKDKLETYLSRSPVDVVFTNNAELVTQVPIARFIKE